MKRLPSVGDDFDDVLELDLFGAVHVMEKKISKRAEELCKTINNKNTDDLLHSFSLTNKYESKF